MVRIVNSNNYVAGDEFELAKTFAIPFVPHFIPTSFVHGKNLNYDGPVLPLEQFLSDLDDKDTLELKLDFYERTLKKCKHWIFAKELMINANLKLQLLANSMLFFLQESFNLQSAIKETLSVDGISRADIVVKTNIYLNAFDHPHCSIGSLMFNIYSFYYKDYFDIYCVNKEYGIFNKTVSRVEHMFTSYMHYKYPDRNMVSGFSSDLGQKYFKETTPDLFCSDTKEGWWFMGCKIHGHVSPNCQINPNATYKTKNFFGHTFEDLNNDMNSKLERVLVNNSNEIDRVTLKWECEFKRDLKRDADLKFFIDHYYVEHPLQRLIPRQAMRGAFIDTYAYRWTKLKCPHENFFAIDVNGLYSSVAIKNAFMVGKYQVVMGKDLTRIRIIGNIFFFDDKRVMGSALVTILPPKGLMFPFLPYRKLDDDFVDLVLKSSGLKIVPTVISNEV